MCFHGQLLSVFSLLSSLYFSKQLLYTVEQSFHSDAKQCLQPRQTEVNLQSQVGAKQLTPALHIGFCECSVCCMSFRPQHLWVCSIHWQDLGSEVQPHCPCGHRWNRFSCCYRSYDRLQVSNRLSDYWRCGLGVYRPHTDHILTSTRLTLPTTRKILPTAPPFGNI